MLGKLAASWLRTAKEPFFLYYAPVASHLPATPAPQDVNSIPYPKPPGVPSFDEQDLSDKPWVAWHKRTLGPKAVEFEDDDIRRNQLESLIELDRTVGAVVDAVADRGLLGSTVFIYLGDNGFLWGEHRLGGKIWAYEESIRVPLVVRVPWAGAERTTRDELVLNIDIASTIAELAGVKPQVPQDGVSLVPLLQGKSPPWRSDFVVEYLGVSQLKVGGPPPFQGVRDERYVYVAYKNGWRELYDLRRDPYQLQNVAGKPAYAAVQKRLAARLAALTRK